ncbi:hypothetical protein B0H19DRAFT_350200 [Mycena capillaripes]|nr:hypothetical protein B0H19DRAFT_350200 [Mycena capillaripes]
MADAVFLTTFSSRLVIEQPLLQTEEDIFAIKNIVRDLLKLAIEKTDFFSDVVPPGSALAYLFIEACVKCSHADLAELVIDMLLIPGVSPDAALMRTCNVLIPLIPSLSALDPPVPGLIKLYRVSVKHYLKQAGNRTPTDAELSVILDAIVGSKDSSMLPNLVRQLSLLPPSEALCRSLITNLRSREKLLTLDNSGGPSISGICTEALKNLVQRTHYSSLSLVVGHVQLCLSTDNIPILAQLFPRLLSPSVTNNRYILEILFPIVPKIQVELASRNISPASPPFGAALKQIFKLYASKVLGPKTSSHSSLVSGVKKWSCTTRCRECEALVNFFLQSQDRQIRLQRIGAPQRKHVEKNLAQFCGYRIANWSTIQSSPQGLQVRFDPTSGVSGSETIVR